jgi:hypothetical protein
MDGVSESETGWGGDSNAEWMNLVVETASIGTWEFDLEQGTGFISERCAEIMGFSAVSKRQLIRFEDWLAMIPWPDRRRVNFACTCSE